MREVRPLPDGAPFENQSVQQFAGSWVGAEGDGSDAQLAGISLRQTSVKDDDQYAVDTRNRGVDGLHLRATHSSGSPVLFDVTDSGVLISTIGGPAESLGPEVGDIKLVYRTLGEWSAKWALCDGTNGTPDMRGRFPIGAGGAFALDATGGAATYNLEHAHTGYAHSHGGSTGSGGSGDTGSNGGGPTPEPSGTKSVTDDGADQTSVSDTDHEHDLDDHDHSLPSHDHSIASGGDGGNTGNAGSTTQSTMPPYRALYFIMRIAA